MVIHYRTEPEYTEYLDGKAYPKVSPRIVHAVIQARLARILSDCAEGRGITGTELDALVGKVDGTNSKFVPDVAFLSYERFRELHGRDRDFPPFAPDIAIEVRSPGDSRAYLDRKFARYLATGASLVLDVDPKTRTIVLHDAAGIRTYCENERVTSTVVPWLAFDLHDVFSVIDDIPEDLRER